MFHRNCTLNQSADSSPSGHVYNFTIFTELLLLLLFSKSWQNTHIAKLWDSGFFSWPLFYDRSDIVTEKYSFVTEEFIKTIFNGLWESLGGYFWYCGWTQLHRKLNFHNISSTLRTQLGLLSFDCLSVLELDLSY